MGKIVYNLDKLLLSRPRMIHYATFNDEQREFINDVIKNYIKPNPILRTRKRFRHRNVNPKSRNFWNLPWEDIVLIRKNVVEENLFEVMKRVYSIDEVQFMQLEVLNVFSCYSWIMEQLKILNAAEEERLKSELSNEEIEAGAKELADYGYYTALRILCPDLTKQNEYMKLPYSIIFRELACSNKVNEINTKYQENAAAKNRRPGQ